MGSAIENAWDTVVDVVYEGPKNVLTSPIDLVKGDFEGWWDKSQGGKSPAGLVWHNVGAADAWEKATGKIFGQDSSYDLTPSESKSACGGGACAKAADETKIPAVAQSISGEAAQAVEAQGTARKRARGIMQTYTRYDSGGNGGKSKLGE